MKVLFIGGTGTISTAISRSILKAAAEHDPIGVNAFADCELYLLNRGNRKVADANTAGYHQIVCDINDEEAAAKALGDLTFDVVCDFILFSLEQAQRDYRLFKDRTKQFMFISSASAYQKPVGDYRITEGTPLANPYWEYSRNKILCEEFFLEKYRTEGFPITIIRPSHTYDERNVPLGVHGKNGSWSVIKRIMDGKTVMIHGDGTSLWTLTHNSDFAKGFMGLMGNIHAIGEAVQITSDETVTWNQVYESIAKALGVKLHAIHVSSEFLAACKDDAYDFTGSLIGDKANSVVFVNTKLKRLVPGFCATVRADEGIANSIRYILEHPECQVDDPDFDAFTDRVVAARETAIAAIRK
ncbi:MAG: NAD-dependent epimerase/dehydratase family protein [Lachnospiraceae bacterium]|nr:NAD-dependent epimerase/dehydratase family protein [Lachnospiraceae bacterium]